MSKANRVRPGGVALNLTDIDALMLQRLLERHLKAIQSSVAFWKRELAFGQNCPFDLPTRETESALVLRLYLALFDENKTNPKRLKINAYKTAKNAEQ